VVRDSIYRVVANNRYSILGKASEEEPPSCQLRYDYATLKERFLDSAEDVPAGTFSAAKQS